MSQVFLSWFPNATFANVFALSVLVAVLADTLVPRLAGAGAAGGAWRGDRGSFLLIQVAALVGLCLTVYLRYLGIGVVPSFVQALAIVLLLLGSLLREWAVVLLGRFFSRTVEIERDHRQIAAGPYRWIRHPAYTGMILTDAATALGLGTWVGALVMLVFMLIASLYRIRVEESALIERFGDDYRAYIERSWRLFPGW